MPNNYVSNGPVSGPIYIPEVDADVDLNAFKFSYQIGMFFTPETQSIPLTLPTQIQPPS